MAVDDTDMAILRELMVGDARHFQSKRERVQDVAKRLGLHRNTVLRRLVRLRLNRFVLPVIPFVDITRLGIQGGRAIYPIPPERRTADLRARLFEVPGVLCLIDYVEGWEVAVSSPDDDLDGLFDQVGTMLGCPTHVVSIRRSTDWPSLPRLELDETDLKIVLAMADDAQASFGAIARKAGLPLRTVQYRHNRLREADLIRMWPGGASQPTGLLVLMVHIEWAEGAKGIEAAQREMLASWPQHFARHQMPRKMWFAGYSSDPARLYEEVESIRARPGIRLVRTLVFRGFDFNPAWHGWVATQLRPTLVAA